MKAEPASAHFDRQRTDTVSGAWYAPTNPRAVADYTGVEFSGYRVTRRVPSPNHTAYWEIACLKCEEKRSVPSSDVKRQRLAQCRCGDDGAKKPIKFRIDGVREEFNLQPCDLHLLLRIMAYEKWCGERPTRLELNAGDKARTTNLARGGWIKTEGYPMRITSMPKAWRELGFTR